VKEADIMDKIVLKEIKEYFVKKKSIKEIEVKDFFFNKYPNKSEESYRRFLMDLYRNNIFYRYDNETFKSSDGKKTFSFVQIIDYDLKVKFETINPPILISYWQLSDLTRFMSLQSFSNIIFVETYSYAADIIINLLLENNKKVVLESDYNTFMKYNSFEEIYVVRFINEDSPLFRKSVSNSDIVKKTNIVSPKIEKIMVDIIIDDFFDTILSDEVYNILVELLKNYQINMSTIKRYATKKHRWSGVKSAIETTGFNIEEGEF
jgi:hypothetical protein